MLLLYLLCILSSENLIVVRKRLLEIAESVASVDYGAMSQDVDINLSPAAT
jgi:hypothetical protein